MTTRTVQTHHQNRGARYSGFTPDTPSTPNPHRYCRCSRDYVEPKPLTIAHLHGSPNNAADIHFGHTTRFNEKYTVVY